MALAAKQQSVQKKLLSLLLVVVLPILGIQGYIYYDRFETRRAEELNANLELARAVGLGFENFVKDVLRHELAIGLAATGSPPLSHPDLTRLLSRSVEEYSPLRGFHWVSPEGRVLASSNPETIGLNLSDRDYQREIVSGREWVLSDLVLSKTTGRPVFTISRSIRDARGQLLGMVMASVEPDGLNPVLAVERAKDAGVSLLDRNGFHVARYPVTEYTWEQRNWGKLYPQVQYALKGEEIASTVKSTSTGKKRLVGFVPVPSVGWVAAASRAQEEAVRPLVSSLVTHLSLFLLVTLGAFAFALTLARRISVSIGTLRDHALALGRGEPPKIQSSTLSEVQEVASAFTEMARKVQDREAALRGSERRLRAFFESEMLGSLFWNMDGQITDANDEFLQMTGYSREDLVAGRISWSQMTPPEYRPPDEYALGELKTKGVDTPYEKEYIRKDGTRFPILIGAAMVDEIRQEGVAFVLDIADRRRAEGELKKAHDKIEGMLQSITDGFLSMDREWRYTYFNETGAGMIGMRKEDLLGRTVWELFPDAVHSKFYTEYHRAVATNAPVHFEEFYPEPLNLWLECHCYPSPEGLSVFFRDITERKHMEKELQRGREHLRSLLDNTVALVGLLTPDGTLIEANRTALAIAGLDREDVLHKSFEEAYWWSWSPEVQDRLRNAISRSAQGEKVRYDEVIRIGDSKFATIDFMLAPIFDSGGRVAYLVPSALDITERKRAEEALEAERARLQAVLDSLPVAVWIADQKGTVIQTNRAVEQVWGKAGVPYGIEKYSEYKGWWADTGAPLRPEDWALARAVLKGEVSTGEVIDIERFDGARGTILNNAAPVREKEGRIIGGVAVAQDITEHKAAEEALRRSEARWNAAIENFAEGAIIATEDEQVIYWNPAARAMHGFTRPDEGIEPLEKTPITFQLWTPDGSDMLELDEWPMRRIKRGETVRNLELRIRRPDQGWEKVFSYNGAMVETAGGERLIFLTCHDLTELRKAEMERRKSEEYIRSSLAEKEVLLKEIHHRVKNNMQVVSSLVSLQADESKDAVIRGVLQDVTHRVRSMAMVHEKLYQSADLARVDFAEYSKSLLHYLWRAHGSTASNVNLALDLEPVLLPVNEAVPCGLILNEVASNALKHAFRGGEGGEVSVSLRGDAQGRVCLNVRDNGAGLPEGFDWTRARSLGLRLVQMLAGQLRAQVEVSRDGGTEFTITMTRDKGSY